MHYRLITACFVSLASTFALAADSPSERVATSLTPYLDENTLAVGAVELDGRWIKGVEQLLQQHQGEANNPAEGQGTAAFVHGVVEQLRKAGGREASIVVGMHDLSIATGPILVITTETAELAPTVAARAGDFVKMLPEKLNDLDVETHEGRVLIGRRPTLDRYKRLRATPRPDLLNPLQRALSTEEQADHRRAGLVVAPGAEARRVLHALWPQLSEPFAKLDGQLIAEALQHIAIEAAAPPEWHASLTVATQNEQSAATVKQLIDDAWQQAIEAASQEKASVQVAATLRRASDVLAAEQEGSRVVLRATHDDPAMHELVASIVVPTIQSARADALREKRINQFKHIALAMHNFADSFGMLPASAAIVSETGKPLLSWRVAVLPYLEQSELFKQFHTDEPWDSPHNLKLVAKMPDVYADSRHEALAAAGKTTYLVPTHPQSVFPPLGENPAVEKRSFLGKNLYFAKGTTFHEITDGTSGTMMVVEVPPEQAVVWTRPADWEVDLAQAWQQLRGGSEVGATVKAFCDGHVKAWDHARNNITELVSMVITRDGGEVIDWNKW